MYARYLARGCILGEVKLIQVQYALQYVVDCLHSLVFKHADSGFRHTARDHISAILRFQLVKNNKRQLLRFLYLLNIIECLDVAGPQILLERNRIHAHNLYLTNGYGHPPPLNSHAQQRACCYDVPFGGFLAKIL